jgi:nucleoside diphosphate kinase
MMCEYTETPYEAILYNCVPKEGGGFDASDWFNKKGCVKNRNPLANLPYIEDGDVIVTQSNACITYLATKLGLYGNTPQEHIEIDQLLCETMDLRNNMVRVFYDSNSSLDALSSLMTQASIGKLNAWLEMKGTKFLVGHRPTAPDFHLYELLDQLKVLANKYSITCWEGSFLSIFYANFSALPFMGSYSKSSLAKLPINNKMAVFGATPSGGKWNPEAIEAFDATSKVRGLRNSALLFVKPHAVTPGVVNMVKGYLVAKGIKILNEGVISSEEIDSKKLIDQHYYAIASKATILKPNELNVPSDKFEKQFGLTWEAALAAGNVYNAMDACALLGITADEMDKQWGVCKKTNKLVKLGGGFYCGLVEMKDKPPMFVFNGFFMAMRSKFTAPGGSIHYFTVEWDSSEISWKSFRNCVLGTTDPAEASPMSLRGLVHRNWESMGLSTSPNVGDNGVHGSASPFEALSERMNWLGVSPNEDPFGAECIAAGIDESTLRLWSVDPQVVLPSGSRGSLFDALEDLDVKQCLTTLVNIKNCC